MSVRRAQRRASRTDALATFEAEGCSAPRAWGNGPGVRYERHDHAFHKVLFCLSGSIVFHTEHGDLELTAGDRLDLAPGTAHAATVARRDASAWRRRDDVPHAS